jgi:hypothetical protein
MSPSSLISFARRFRIPLSIIGIISLFGFYTYGIANNPPGSYLDESGMAYNAYLLAHTGAGEFGPHFPLFFQFYTGGYTQFGNPTQIYMLAIAFFLLPVSMVLARLVAAAFLFSGCLLIGWLAARVSKRPLIGIIVGLTALLTPWFVDLSRLVLDIFVYPLAIALFLLALYRAQTKERWALTSVFLVLTLALVTYTYTIGRTLGPALAFGLVFFAHSRERLSSIFKTWIGYGLMLIPMLVFNLKRPGQLMERFYLISYVKPESSLSEIIPRFIERYFQDLSLRCLLLVGDTNPRHHIPNSMGSLLLATFVLAIIGIIVILVRHRNDPWWWFVLFGTAVSVVPGALTLDQFHTLRMVAYPIFLLVLTVPALTWLLEDPESAKEQDESEGNDQSPETAETASLPHRKFGSVFSTQNRRSILAMLLVLTLVQGAYFQLLFHREGPKRGDAFDTSYKEVYDQATALPTRPIYLVDGYWGPGYIHAFWYATLEHRPVTEFIHQPYQVRPPSGSLVISSDNKCANCQMLFQRGIYTLYRMR